MVSSPKPTASSPQTPSVRSDPHTPTYIATTKIRSTCSNNAAPFSTRLPAIPPPKTNSPTAPYHPSNRCSLRPNFVPYEPHPSSPGQTASNMTPTRNWGSAASSQAPSTNQDNNSLSPESARSDRDHPWTAHSATSNLVNRSMKHVVAHLQFVTLRRSQLGNLHQHRPSIRPNFDPAHDQIPFVIML